MQVFTTIRELKDALAKARGSGQISFVPTMGYLHEGHLSLAEIAKKRAKFCVVSIFVNPLQFNNPEDLKKYPRNLEKDLSLLEKVAVDFVFAPAESEMLSAVEEKALYQPAFTQDFEAKFRPGHFEGVCAIVSLLFKIVEPNFAVFGEKDFQQLRIIEQMVQDLKLPIKIIRGTTLRDLDGLAKSSRNVRLSPEARGSALALSRGLFAVLDAFHKTELDTQKLKALALDIISKEPGLVLEYLEIIDGVTFKSTEKATVENRVILAASVDGVRLIDNVELI